MDSPANVSEDFGLSSSDEADMLALATATPSNSTNGTNGKRKHEDETSDRPHKLPHNGQSTALSVATQVLNEHFGLPAFRLKQAAVIERLLEGGSAVVVFPTGGGKSLCYQIPALAFKEMDRRAGIRQGRAEGGITLVVSPLIALMKDQVDALKRKGISAAVLDSTKTRDEYLATVESMRNGTLDILYCAPERLNNEGFVASMAHVRGGIRLLAVDEAHCISEWGHAFRPDYLKVARFAKEIDAERVVALTATATPTVAQDVRRAFDMADDSLFRTATYRRNLRLQALSFETKKDSYPHLISFLKANPGPSIIYVTLQQQTEDLAGELRKSGFKARHFHAGMDASSKTVCQDMFMSSPDLIIVATIAFGMGIDKANIRNVVHYDIPRSLEGYSQEIGRAGRDGLPSHCLLYLCPDDLHIRESFARGDLPSHASVTNLLHEILSTKPVMANAGAVIEASLYQQAQEHDIKQTVLSTIYAQLELSFKLLRATTPKYTSYSYKYLGSVKGDKSKASIAIQRAASTKTKKSDLYHIDIDATARSSSLLRVDIVTKLNEWNDGGLIELRTSGVLNVYRIMQPLPTKREERQAIADELYHALVKREQQDLRRMEDMIDLITGSACLARSLAEHFGDSLPNNSRECGHCTWCETHRAVTLIEPPELPWNSAAFKAVLKACPDRDDPRYLARIAFGIYSPRVTKAKLSKDAAFGSMADHDFMALLQAFTKVCDET